MSKLDHIKRYVKYWWQRRTRGFDDEELWNLDSTFSRYMAPRISAFRKYTHSYPHDDLLTREGDMGLRTAMTPEKWDEILEKMQLAFEYYGSDARWESETMHDYEKHREGLELFARYFGALWD